MFLPRFLKCKYFLFIFAPFLVNLNITAEEFSKLQDSSFLEYKDEYIIDAGDTLFLDFKGLEDIFSGNYVVPQNSFLKLPEIGRIKVKGKTLVQLQDILEAKYSEFLYNPNIELSISNHRDLSISLRGEVNKTGLFFLNYKLEENFNKANLEENRSGFSPQTAPRLFDLIQLAEGITTNADLRNIEVTRKNAEINGGGLVKTKIDLISLLESGNQSVNIILRDGDDVFVPKSEKVLLDQLVSVNRSNLTPDFVDIFVNGNVEKTGLLTLRQGVSLNEAIAAAGGIKSMSGQIEFIRLSRDSEPEKRLISVRKAKKGSRNNPILITGDIIFVRKSLAGKASTVILDYSRPIVNAYGIYKIFE
ncbi:polysaccharide export-related periplasmic protein [Prochlorococcus marinus str. MIT 9201]|uniref:Polysaccharide export-related periplasmic protein n=1 Tax=Prochlorococcus marinus str. MIT 9201 TaxID=93057 RepID=A0A0A2A4Y4_PROMR|nr:polysaccharide biosynthesis/export family protein [Prochlorococcus marinus]KGF96655.1 polysaccharide export-related periplasmic protein [Prochlorococcus marinus str. MIT 9201]